MARNYAALPYEYLEEMAELDDAEFGRLMRALLQFSMTGEVAELEGNERFYRSRVITRERRYQESYESTAAKNRENGKKGGRPKKTDKPTETQKTEAKAKAEAKTKAKAKTEAEAEKSAPPSGDGGSEAAAAAVVRAYLERINPRASQSCRDELCAHARRMGAEVCLRAMDIAVDSNAATWRYIRGILRRWQALGVACPEDIGRLDRKDGKNPPPEDGGSRDSPAMQVRLQRDMAGLSAVLNKGGGTI